MNKAQAKQRAAEAALRFIEDDMVVGVGTGSTVDCFIDALAALKHRIDGAVPSSNATARRLQESGIRVLELNDTGDLPIYVDGADECDPHKRLIKGGGGALTREKIIAGASERFICIVDESKLVDTLGTFPLPVEVIPMARSFVARQLFKHDCRPELRTGFTTDNGNLILDLYDMKLTDPVAVESELNQIPGVVCVGLFARRPADRVIVGGVEATREF